MNNQLRQYRLLDKKIKNKDPIKLKDKNIEVVSLYISDEFKAYNEYTSLKEDEINEEIIHYLKQKIKYLPLKLTITIKIGIKSANKNILKKIENLIRKNIAERIQGLNQDLKQALKIIFILMIFGIISLLLLAYFSENQSRLGMIELMSIVTWVFIWRAVEIYFFERQKIKHQKLKLMQLYLAKFTLELN